MVKAIEALGEEIVDHIEITERHDGLYAEIVEAAPQLSHKVQMLRAEHPEMQEATSSLKARLTGARAGDARSVDEARDEIRRLLGRLVKHRQLGADLVWEAHSHDIGGGGQRPRPGTFRLLAPGKGTACAEPLNSRRQHTGQNANPCDLPVLAYN